MTPQSNRPPDSDKRSFPTLKLQPPPKLKDLWRDYPESVRHFQRLVDTHVVTPQQCAHYLDRLTKMPPKAMEFWFFQVFLYEEIIKEERSGAMTMAEVEAFFNASEKVLLAVPDMRVMSPEVAASVFRTMLVNAEQHDAFDQETWNRITETLHAQDHDSPGNDITSMRDPEPHTSIATLLRDATMLCMRGFSTFGTLTNMSGNKHLWFAFVRLIWPFLEAEHPAAEAITDMAPTPPAEALVPTVTNTSAPISPPPLTRFERALAWIWRVIES